MNKDKITHFSFTGDLSSVLFLTSTASFAFKMEPFFQDGEAVYLPKDPVVIAEYVPQNKRFVLIVPKSATNSVLMHDMRDGCIKDEYPTEDPVLAICVTGNHIVLKTQKEVVIYHIDTPEPVQKFPSFHGEDERSLAVSKVLSTGEESYFFVAFPGTQQGTISIAKSVLVGESEIQCTITNTIDAHNGFVKLLAMSEDGTIVASASEKGTCIRVFKPNPSGPQKIGRSGKYKEFHRGYTHGAIVAMRISPNNEILAVLSANGTCHLYGLTGNIANNWKLISPNSVSSYCDIACGVMDNGEIRFGPDSKTIYIACSNGKCMKHELSIDKDKHIVSKELYLNPIKIF